MPRHRRSWFRLGNFRFRLRLGLCFYVTAGSLPARAGRRAGTHSRLRGGTHSRFRCNSWQRRCHNFRLRRFDNSRRSTDAEACEATGGFGGEELARLARRINRLPGDRQRRIADEPRVIAVAPHHAYEFSAGIEERAGRRFEGVIPQFFEIVVDADDITRRVALSARRIRRRRRPSIGECCLERIAIVLLGATCTARRRVLKSSDGGAAARFGTVAGGCASATTGRGCAGTRPSAHSGGTGSCAFASTLTVGFS